MVEPLPPRFYPRLSGDPVRFRPIRHALDCPSLGTAGTVVGSVWSWRWRRRRRRWWWRWWVRGGWWWWRWIMVEWTNQRFPSSAIHERSPRSLYNPGPRGGLEPRVLDRSSSRRRSHVPRHETWGHGEREGKGEGYERLAGRWG
jgi:hypothetical protein